MLLFLEESTILHDVYEQKYFAHGQAAEQTKFNYVETVMYNLMQKFKS